MVLPGDFGTLSTSLGVRIAWNVRGRDVHSAHPGEHFQGHGYQFARTFIVFCESNGFQLCGSPTGFSRLGRWYAGATPSESANGAVENDCDILCTIARRIARFGCANPPPTPATTRPAEETASRLAACTPVRVAARSCGCRARYFPHLERFLRAPFPGLGYRTAFGGCTPPTGPGRYPAAG